MGDELYHNYLIKKPIKDIFGIFTEISIPKNKPIIEITGSLYDRTNRPVNANDYLQVSNKWFIGPSGGSDDIIRHSCNPNCYIHAVGKRAILYSLNHIREGSELTFDYSTTSTESLEEWSMQCNCESFNCRKIISGYQYLDSKLKKEYEKRGMVPSFIVKPMFVG